MKLAPATSIDSLDVQRIFWDAFGPDHGPQVASIATDLLVDDTAQPSFAFLAEEDGIEVGCIIFSNLYIEGAGQVKASLLAPLGVMKEYQNRGLGKGLVLQGLGAIESYGIDAVFAYGDPSYYQRFGFSNNHFVSAPYKLKYPEAWMALELRTGVLEDVMGRAICAAPLNDPSIW